MTLTDIQNMLQDVDFALEGLLPSLGQGELVPIVDMVTKLAEKLAAAIAAKGAAAPTLAAEVAAADAAADAVEAAKFRGKP